MRMMIRSLKPITKLTQFERKKFSTKYISEGCIYVHWPYCKQRCSYCNFVKFVKKSGTFWTFPNHVIEDQIVKELKYSLNLSPIKEIKSVFFGGGTPSLANPSLIMKVLNAISEQCSLSSSAEITLEANPTQLETDKLKEFNACGVNRLSLGVQSLNSQFLKLLNRDHSVDEAVSCIHAAKKIFHKRVSVDLMFGLPSQSLMCWEDDLKSMLKIVDNHLSLYQLTLERGTKLFNDASSGKLHIPSDEEKADMYELAIEMLKDSGFYRYEVSNFANCSQSESVHNMSVWQGTQYLGVGPGAHSRVVAFEGTKVFREARVNVPDPANWLRLVDSKGHGVRKIVKQTELDCQLEYIATSLRTLNGAQEHRWKEFCPKASLINIIPPLLLDPNLMYYQNGNLRTTAKGLNLLDRVLPDLFNVVESFNYSK